MGRDTRAPPPPAAPPPHDVTRSSSHLTGQKGGDEFGREANVSLPYTEMGQADQVNTVVGYKVVITMVSS